MRETLTYKVVPAFANVGGMFFVRMDSVIVLMVVLLFPSIQPLLSFSFVQCVPLLLFLNASPS